MKIKRKSITVLQMTPEEVQMFEDMIHEAAVGHTVHYSERQTGANAYFGISVHESHREPTRAEREARHNGEAVEQPAAPRGWDKV